MNKWLFFGLVLLLVFLTTWSALGYEVNRPLDVRVKLQYDDGLTLTDVVSQACIMSVYFQGDSSLLVRDGNMSAGSYHNFSFTPSSVGDYVLSVKCVYNNESAVYHETVSIVGQTINPPVGGQVLNLNARIVPESDVFVVNLEVNSSLEFFVYYYLDGGLVNSNEAVFRVLRDDVVLDSGGFVIRSTGEYVFNFDFKDYVTGDYRVVLYFDGRTEFVDVKVISVSKRLSLITGFVTGDDGDVSVFRVGLLLFFVFFVLFLLLLFVRSLRRGSGNKR